MLSFSENAMGTVRSRTASSLPDAALLRTSETVGEALGADLISVGSDAFPLLADAACGS